MRGLGWAVLAATALAGCSASGHGSAAPDRSTASTTTAVTTASTTATTTSTTAATTPTTTPAAERWTGVVWSPSADGGGPLIDGQPSGLTSVSGLCRMSDCREAFDLLTASPVDSGPPTGPYVLWAERANESNASGVVSWTITDARDVTIEDGSSIFLCVPIADSGIQVLGIGVASTSTDGATVTPDQVWDVDDSGSIVTPDPAGYRCEIGQD